jgi:hypothetical protein
MHVHLPKGDWRENPAQRVGRPLITFLVPALVLLPCRGPAVPQVSDAFLGKLGVLRETLFSGPPSNIQSIPISTASHLSSICSSLVLLSKDLSLTAWISLSFVCESDNQSSLSVHSPFATAPTFIPVHSTVEYLADTPHHGTIQRGLSQGSAPEARPIVPTWASKL